MREKLTVKQAAQRLGVSLSAVYQLVKKGTELDVYDPPSGKMMIFADSVDEFIERHTKRREVPEAQPEQESITLQSKPKASSRPRYTPVRLPLPNAIKQLIQEGKAPKY